MCYYLGMVESGSGFGFRPHSHLWHGWAGGWKCYLCTAYRVRTEDAQSGQDYDEVVTLQALAAAERIRHLSAWGKRWRGR